MSLACSRATKSMEKIQKIQCNLFWTFSFPLRTLNMVLVGSSLSVSSKRAKLRPPKSWPLCEALSFLLSALLSLKAQIAEPSRTFLELLYLLPCRFQESDCLSHTDETESVILSCILSAFCGVLSSSGPSESCESFEALLTPLKTPLSFAPILVNTIFF
jgi:hypothetical protein